MSAPTSYMTLSTPEVCEITGVTFRQLDHWCRHGIVRPLVDTTGSGVYRVWDVEQVGAIEVMGRLSRALSQHGRTGVSLDLLRRVAGDPYAGRVVLSDGIEVRWEVPS